MEVICDYSDDSMAYKCFISNQDISDPHLVKDYVGEHIGTRTNKDIISVSFVSCALRTFPRNLMKFFPRLLVIEILSCDLKELTKYDLINYSNLVYLSVIDNQLTHLSSDLFEYTPNIQYVDFSCNQIASIGPRIFDSLKHLILANFSSNRNIDELYDEDTGISYEEFLDEIKEYCRPMESLKGIAAETLTGAINSSNATEIFFYSCRFDLVGLKRKSFDYIKEKMFPWLNEDMINEPENLLKIVGKKKWGSK